MNDEIFRSSEQDYFEVSRSIKQDLEVLRGVQGDKRKKLIDKVNKSLKSGNDAMRQMDMEVSGIVNPQSKENLRKRFQICKNDFNDLKRSFEEAQKENLFLGGKEAGMTMQELQATGSATSEEYKQKLRDNTQKAKDSRKIVDKINQSVIEIESTAITSADELHTQGTRIRQMRDRVSDVLNNIKSGNRLISKMGKNNVIQKIIIVGVILMLLGAIAFVLLLILYRPILSLIDIIKNLTQKSSSK